MSQFFVKQRWSGIVLWTIFLAACTTAGREDAQTSRPAQKQQDLALLNRVTWGGNTAVLQAMTAQGSAAYLEQQLHPAKDDGLPERARAEISALRIEREPLLSIAASVHAQHVALVAINDADRREIARKAYEDALNVLGKEAVTRSLLRDLYSRNQLQEQMRWFWFNHFNVYIYKNDIRALIGDYEDHAIGPHVFGRFRDLLMATVHHSAMLLYLDNAQNSAGHINENYAREIMELHTLGVNAGYTQKDVQELARILTGLGVNETEEMPNVRPKLQDQYVHDGLFEFNPNRHDYGDKLFLGHVIKGRGLAEVDEAIDILCRHPATAHFISLQLAQFFVSDGPAPALVDRMAKTFQQTDGDIAAILRTMFASFEFKASLGNKFKDPMHFIISAVRVTQNDNVALNVTPIMDRLKRMGEPLFAHDTPNGYSLTQAAWSGPGEMEVRFEIARTLGSRFGGLFKSKDAQDALLPSPPQIAVSPYYEALQPSLSPATQQSLAQTKAPVDWNMLFLSSPEFMHR